MRALKARVKVLGFLVWKQHYEDYDVITFNSKWRNFPCTFSGGSRGGGLGGASPHLPSAPRQPFCIAQWPYFTRHVNARLVRRSHFRAELSLDQGLGTASRVAWPNHHNVTSHDVRVAHVKQRGRVTNCTLKFWLHVKCFFFFSFNWDAKTYKFPFRDFFLFILTAVNIGR